MEQLGGRLTEEPGECSHLVMGSLSRTNNLLLCLPTVSHCLTPAWVQESASAGRWLPEADYALSDTDVEARFGFSLARTLARTSRDKLFAGKVFYLTPSVKPSLAVLSNIVTNSGGRSATLPQTSIAVHVKD